MSCKVMKNLCTYVRIFLDRVIDFIFSLYWEGKKQPIPNLEKRHAFLAESAVTLARRIKQKELKSEDLVRAVIQRIKEVNPIINAVVENRYEAAINEAKEVDKMIEIGLSEEDAKEKPFLGVPFTTKESQAMQSFHLTLGLWSRRDLKANEDSLAIVRLKQAGAIPVAATNLPELLIWQETRNNVYGMTNNPHHTGRTPGGSSGAEAALTATYATAISLCSDLGGSTRMPAFFTGMFGHHPTANVTNCKGVMFRNGDEESMLSLGFITKHVEDLGPLMKVIAGDKADLLKLDRDVNIKDLKFYYMESSDDCHVSPIRPELKDVMKRVISNINEKITTTTNSPQPYQHEGFSYMYKLWNYWMTKEPENFANMYTNYKGEANGFVEIIKKLLGQSKHCLSAIVRLIELQTMPKANAQWAEKLTKDLKDDLISKLGTNGVLLFPSGPHPAQYHYSSFLRPYNFAYWAIINALKFPSTQVPIGVNSQRLPLGLQVVAAPNNDALCLAVAGYLEKEFGGAVMACKITSE